LPPIPQTPCLSFATPAFKPHYHYTLSLGVEAVIGAEKQQNVKFPYEKFRRGQREVAEAVRKAVELGQLLALQAPTGFGKTAAVIYGLLLANVDRVLYVVRTRNEIAPVTRELEKFGVNYTFLYSARRMCPLLRRSNGEEMPSIDEFWENCKLARLKGVCNYFNSLSEVDRETIINIIREGGGDPFKTVKLLIGYGLCPFFALKSIIDDVKIVVATYPYLFRHRIFESVFEPHEYNDFHIVVDEAHSLIEAHTMIEEKLRARDVEAALREIREYTPDYEGAIEALERLLDYIRNLKIGDRLKRVDKAYVVEILGDPQNWIDIATEIRLEKVKRVLEEAPERTTRVKVATARIAIFAEALAQEESHLYASMEKREKTLHVLPCTPCSVVGEPLSRAKSVILMSGTLPPASYIRDVLCIKKQTLVYDVEMFHGIIYSQKQYYTIVLVDVSSKYTSRTSEMFDRYAKYLETTYKLVKGVVLAVYPSYEFMHNVVSRLPQDYNMIVEGKETTISEVREIAFSSERLLINAVAGGKLSEGVELINDKGESLIKVVFVAGVPYPQPDDLLLDFMEWLESRVGKDNTNYYVYTVTAAIRVKQALGRAIRGPNDRALYVLGDRRFFYQRLRDLLKIKYNRVVHNVDDYRLVLEKMKWLRE